MQRTAHLPVGPSHIGAEFNVFCLSLYLLVGYVSCCSKNDLRLYWELEVMLSGRTWATLLHTLVPGHGYIPGSHRGHTSDVRAVTAHFPREQLC